MNRHALRPHICPYCLKHFDTIQGVKAHQKIKRHRVEDRCEEAPQERALRRYDHDRRQQLKRAEANAP